MHRPHWHAGKACGSTQHTVQQARTARHTTPKVSASGPAAKQGQCRRKLQAANNRTAQTSPKRAVICPSCKARTAQAGKTPISSISEHCKHAALKGGVSAQAVKQGQCRRSNPVGKAATKPLCGSRTPVRGPLLQLTRHTDFPWGVKAPRTTVSRRKGANSICWRWSEQAGQEGGPRVCSARAGRRGELGSRGLRA